MSCFVFNVINLANCITLIISWYLHPVTDLTSIVQTTFYNHYYSLHNCLPFKPATMILDLNTHLSCNLEHLHHFI